MLAQIYVRLDNGLEIHTKTKNAFDAILKDCRSLNENRRDGFTDILMDYIEKYKIDLFKEPDISYVALVNIYNEAYAVNAQDALSNLEAVEKPIGRQIMELYKKRKYTPSLSYEEILEDSKAVSKIKDLI
jgi:hypothetical protein